MPESMPTSDEIEKAKTYAPAPLSGSPRFDVWLEIAAHRVSRAYFGGSYVYALSLVACHVGSMEMRAVANGGDGSDVGSVSSKSEGGLSVSYSSASDSSGDGDYSQTTYGRSYLSLLRSLGRTPNLAVPGMA